MASKAQDLPGMRQVSSYLQTEYLPVTSSHYYTIGASDNNADCSGRCDTGWRDDDNNTVDPDSNSRWDNSRWNTLALRKW